MKRYLACFAATVCMIGILSGCSRKPYVSVTPHAEQPDQPLLESVEVSSFSQLKQALSDVVATGEQECIIYLNELEEQVAVFYMDAAIRQIISNDPMGVYAVNKINYEMGTNAGRSAVAVNIAYKHGRGEILRIKNAPDMDQASQIIATAIGNRSENVVILVQDYEQMDILSMVSKYAADHPDIVMEVPEVSAATFPSTGKERVLEVIFSYQTEREQQQEMVQEVEPVFTSAELYVTVDASEFRKAEQLYSFLMERFDYQIQSSNTPTYSLLQDGIGDDRAFACVYAQMCRTAGVNCWAIKGEYMGSERWWNGFLMKDGYYYVDLLRCNDAGNYSLLTDRQMSGYSWDREFYMPLEQKDTQ